MSGLYPAPELHQLVAAARERHIDVVADKGGHFGGTLGVAELTVALHHAYDTPRDRLVWDTGHQGLHPQDPHGPERAVPLHPYAPRTRPLSFAGTSRSTTCLARDTRPRRSLRPGGSPLPAT